MIDSDLNMNKCTISHLQASTFFRTGHVPRALDNFSTFGVILPSRYTHIITNTKFVLQMYKIVKKFKYFMFKSNMLCSYVNDIYILINLQL